MAKRKSFNRIYRRYSKRRSADSFGSGHLDPDTAIMDEERTFWWNNLEENTFPPHSIYNENETARQLSANSRIDSSQSSVTTGWWKNLDSENEPIASTSSRHSAAIVKRNILQTSTSESEKELDLRKRKVRLKASNRKSVNNAFANALNDTETTMPLKLRMKQVHSEVHSDSDSESPQGRSQENEEDSKSSSTSKILKSKPSIFRTRRGRGDRKDQNVFQDVLSEDDVLNGNTAKISVAFEKESSKHRNINTSKDHIDDQRESIRAVENIKTGSLTPNVEKVARRSNAEIVQSSDESIVIHRQHLKFKSRFTQQTRKSIGKNAFADALIDDSNGNLSTSNPNKENSIHRSSLSRSLPLGRSKVNIDIIPESSTFRRSSRLSLNITRKQQSDISVQDKDNIETSLSSSSLDNNKSRGTKRSIFLKPKSRILKRKRSTNPFEEIFKQGNTSDRESNVSTEDNRASFERETSINQERKSLVAQKNPQSEKNNTTDEEDSYEISLEVSPNVEKSRSKNSNILPENENKLLENSNLNASKSFSRKSVIAKSSEEKISSRKSIRENDSTRSYIITRADIHSIDSTDNTIVGTQKSTILSTEKEVIDDEDAESAIQAIQRNSLTKPGTSKTVNRQNVQSSNRTSIKDREIAPRQKSLDKSQNYRNASIKSSSKDISSNKQSSSKALKKIDDFFKIKEISTKQLSEPSQKSQIFDSEKMKKIKMELEKLKSREMVAMKINPTDKKESAVKKERMKFVIPKQDTKKKKKKKPLMNSTIVDKAFLVNGKVYRPPRLPRPKHWATDRLYKFLWKRLEPKYKLATRVKSEKFVQELAKVVAIIECRKSYENYKTELKALMKEMARLKLINTRMDFYHFCQDFLPYEFRVKVVPMLLPGNKSNIPFHPENVHTPLLDTE